VGGSGRASEGRGVRRAAAATDDRPATCDNRRGGSATLGRRLNLTRAPFSSSSSSSSWHQKKKKTDLPPEQLLKTNRCSSDLWRLADWRLSDRFFVFFARGFISKWIALLCTGQFFFPNFFFSFFFFCEEKKHLLDRKGSGR
jgi:hypothetical protein